MTSSVACAAGRALPALWLLAALAATPAQAAPREIVVSGDDGQPLADAVVAVELRGAGAVARPGGSVEMAQRQRRFEPGLLVVQTGTEVRFPNFDTVRHHVYSFSPAKTFELKLYAGTPAAPVLFDRPGVAVLGCNIHDKMAAWIVVVDTPLFARTDAAGRATLDLPPGAHRVRLWHASLRETMQEQTLQADGPTLALRLSARP